LVRDVGSRLKTNDKKNPLVGSEKKVKKPNKKIKGGRIGVPADKLQPKLVRSEPQ